LVDLFLFFLLGFFYLVRNCEIEREMNNLSYLEPDYSEFVEVDPTGRYGRVMFPPINQSISIILFDLLLTSLFLLLQYNEVLGKGASKTV
jgi:hypothetical protein